MYSNDRKTGFSVLDLLVKIIFAALFVFLLIWLFKKNVPNMAPFYSNVFRENIKYMQEAGESYFTDDRMPKEVGQSTQISLADMYDKKLILPFVDKDGKACDTKKSYVTVRKDEKEYILSCKMVGKDSMMQMIRIAKKHAKNYEKDLVESAEFDYEIKERFDGSNPKNSRIKYMKLQYVNDISEQNQKALNEYLDYTRSLKTKEFSNIEKLKQDKTLLLP